MRRQEWPDRLSYNPLELTMFSRGEDCWGSPQRRANPFMGAAREVVA
jgi:hypothetical protein